MFSKLDEITPSIQHEDGNSKLSHCNQSNVMIVLE